MNQLVVPYSLHALVVGTVPVPDEYCPDNRMYIIDAEGNVHYFQYLGKNLLRGETSDAQLGE